MEKVTIQPNTANGPANFVVRVDGFGRIRGTRMISLIDAKASDTAQLSKRQSEGYPLIAKYGGTVVGKKGDSAFRGEIKILPTTVKIIRPADLPPP